MGYIEAICISKRKGVVKKRIDEATLIAGWGIQGDAHAGKWHRQVSILAGESIERIKQKLPDVAHGAFAENLVTRDVELSRIEPGDRLIIGDGIVLEISQIGKECHRSCRIKELVGDCIMPTEGVFAVVVRGGIVKTGDVIEFIGNLPRCLTGESRK
jgi:MOSC domain-containing protein YiiM